MGTPRHEPYIFSMPSPSSAIALAGAREENLKLLAEESGVRLVMRGQDLLIDGTTAQISLCEQIVKSLRVTDVVTRSSHAHIASNNMCKPWKNTI